MHRQVHSVLLTLFLVFTCFLGCGPAEAPDYGINDNVKAGDQEGDGDGGDTSDAEQSQGDGEAEPKGPTLQPFDAPPLAEIEKNTKWNPGLVVDAHERMRKWKAESKPQISIDELRRLQFMADHELGYQIGSVRGDAGAMQHTIVGTSMRAKASSSSSR